MAKKKQTCILILGLHHSGSSVLIELMQLLGIYTSSRKEIFDRLNQELLTQIKSSWDDLTYRDSKLDAIEGIEVLEERIEQEFEYADTFALSGVGLTYLLPLYQKVLKHLEIECKVVLLYRNPIRVVDLLKSNEGVLMEQGMLLWSYYFLFIEHFSRPYDRVFVSFEELCANPSMSIEDIFVKLHLDMTQTYQQNQSKIKSLLDANMQSDAVALDNLSSKTPKVIQEIIALKEKFYSENTIKKFDNIFERFVSFQELFYSKSVVEELEYANYAKEALKAKQEDLAQAKKIIEQKTQALMQSQSIIEQKTQEYVQRTQNLVHQQHRELEQKTQALDDRGNELIGVHKRVGELSYEVEEKAKEQKKLKVELEKAHQDIGQLSHGLDQTQRELNSTNGALEQTQKALGERVEEVDNLQDELVALYMGRSWKITRPLRKIMRVFKR